MIRSIDESGRDAGADRGRAADGVRAAVDQRPDPGRTSGAG